MQENKIAILSTRPLSRQQLDEATAAGIDIETLSFIETEPILTVEVQQEIEQAYLREATIVFTSMNAVDAVAKEKYIAQPRWKIYCIGHATCQLVKNYFGESNIAGIANSAAELAGLIVKNGNIDEVIFFCGDIRREELPSILLKAGINTTEVVVYHTVATPHKVDKRYAGILFFSPSAVDSFFRNNKLPESTVLFAIGNTTAGEIRKHTNNKVVISEGPVKGDLVKEMIEYFT